MASWRTKNPVALLPSLLLLAAAFCQQTLASANAQHHLANKAVNLDATITAAPDPHLVNLRLYPRHAGSSDSPDSSTGTPKGRDACSALYSAYSWCSTSGFTNLAGTSALASCACYYNKSYVPHVFDGLATSCYDYIRSVSPDATAAVAQYLNVCYLAGDISKSASIGSLACNTLASVLNSCGNRTPRSSDYVFSGSSSLADCACYSRTKYAPEGFDHLASSCYTYAQNLAGQGGQISTLLNFCDTVGDVRLSASQALSQCKLFEDQYGACELAYSRGNFGTLPASLQASCLCYGARATWVPGIIDGAAKTCVGYLSTADPARAKSLSAYADDFCEGFGNVRSSTSISTTTSTSAEPESTTTLPPSTIATAINSTAGPIYTVAPTRTRSTEANETETETSLPIPTATGAGSHLNIPSLQVLTTLLFLTITSLVAGL
ncbi:hypothetical protein TWF481_011728 [Arthrobotrys musiformis]|uniref:Uncharacterized protein n=1 Tax=Arthrobotrys musiformis TaxID=47236 RepID=A0AAV9W0J5_9PEZI